MRTRTKATLWLMLTFLAGIVLGGSATFLTLQWASPPATAAARPPDRPPPPPERVANRINERAALNLSESQLESLIQILARRRDQVNDVTEESGRRIEAIREAANEEIRRILDPEQRVKYERHLEEWLRRRAAQESDRPPPRPGSGAPPSPNAPRMP